jgi:hypothetical protein
MVILQYRLRRSVKNYLEEIFWFTDVLKKDSEFEWLFRLRALTGRKEDKVSNSGYKTTQNSWFTQLAPFRKNRKFKEATMIWIRAQDTGE